MTDISNNTRTLVASAVKSGLRLNGRKLLEQRKLQIVFDYAQEGVEVHIGNTRVFTKVSAKIVEPRKARPQEGFLRFNVNLSLTQEPSHNFST